MSDMKRREFMTLLGGAATWPFAAHAQQTAMPVIGFLDSNFPDLSASRVGAFRQGLGEAGYVEGRNAVIEYRWAEGQSDRLPALAADLVRDRVAVIAAAGGLSARAAKAATAMIPIIFWIEGDPVQVGLVATLNRPGGNLTGATTLGAELTVKRLELLRELVPMAAIAALIDPTTLTAAAVSRDLQSTARTLGLQLHVLHATTERDVDAAFAAMIQLQAGGLVIGPGPVFVARSKQLAAWPFAMLSLQSFSFANSSQRGA